MNKKENLCKEICEPRGQEDGSEVGGSWTHLLMYPTGTSSWSSKEQSEQPTESQLIWNLEDKVAENT